MPLRAPEITGGTPGNCRYCVIVWDNAGQRSERPGGNALAEAKILARANRTLANRTVKIGQAGNALFHWSRSTHLDRNHWTSRATADEWFN